MGAKAWFAVCSNGDPKQVLANAPVLDAAATRTFLARMFPDQKNEDLGETTLLDLDPRNREIRAGVYGDLVILAHEGFAKDKPSEIPRAMLAAGAFQNTYVHATHSVVDWYAISQWKQGELGRSLSLSPDNGIIENIGEPLSFEAPFWDGEFAMDDEDEYPLPFHPLDLSEVALAATVGFGFGGDPSTWVCDPIEIPILSFELDRAKSGGIFRKIKGLFG